MVLPTFGIPELKISIFIIPANFGGRHEYSGVKNGEERVVILNHVAMLVIDNQRDIHPQYVFPYKGKPLARMNDSAWRKARKRAAIRYVEDHNEEVSEGFYNVRVHDLKHTFGRRLRAAGVTKEDRQVLLGHTNGNVTTHYSMAELGNLIEAANKISAEESRETPVLTLLKRRKKLVNV